MTPRQAKDLAVLALAACPSSASFLDEEAMLAMYTIWADILEDIDQGEGRAALKRYLASPANAGKLPSPGHIRGIVDEARHGQRRAGGDAWGDVVRLRSRFSAHRFPTADDVADELAWWCITRMGWLNLCNSDNEIADRAQFVKLYDAEATKVAGNRAIAGLPGAAGSGPALPGSSSPALALVGDVARRLGAGGSR